MAQHAERPQPHHFAALSEDSKPSTHDFLSLYDKGLQRGEHSSGLGLSSSLTTHDFLQPLERGGAQAAYRDIPTPRTLKLARGDDIPSCSTATAVAVDRHLLTAIPNYATIQVPYARVMEVPSDAVVHMMGECESLRGRGYHVATLSSREEHSGPEVLRGVEVAVNTQENLAYWSGVRLKFGLPRDLTFPAGAQAAKVVAENDHQPTPVMAKQWTQVTQGMIEVPKRPVRPPSDEDEDEDEDSQEQPRGNRKDTMLQKGDTAQKMDQKCADMKGGTPRSKHSATEQRRRSKINDRFQMLRDLVPHSDQKRDKASLLLEVIDYIQLLQEKVCKYETAEQGRHQERLKSMVWDFRKRGPGSGDEASQINAVVFAKEFSPVGAPLDVKQVTEVAADLTRARAPRPSDHAGRPAFDVHSCGAHDSQHGTSRPACSIHSCVSSLDGKPQNGALVAEPLPVGVPAQQTMALPYALALVPPKQQHEQVSARGTPTPNSPVKDNPSHADLPCLHENSYHPGPAQASSPDYQFEVRPGCSPSRQADKASGQLSKAEPHTAKFVGRVDGAEAGGNVMTTASHVSRMKTANSGPPKMPHAMAGAPRQSQVSTPSHDNASGNARHLQAQQNDQQVAVRDGSGSPLRTPMSIQGGIINVSSVYSEGLLDTLTRALQSSGVDLRQANISVQIDLGKNATAADIDISTKAPTTPESSVQSHQSQGRTRPLLLATEREHALKRPKLEAEH